MCRIGVIGRRFVFRQPVGTYGVMRAYPAPLGKGLRHQDDRFGYPMGPAHFCIHFPVACYGNPIGKDNARIDDVRLLATHVLDLAATEIRCN